MYKKFVDEQIDEKTALEYLLYDGKKVVLLRKLFDKCIKFITKMDRGDTSRPVARKRQYGPMTELNREIKERDERAKNKQIQDEAQNIPLPPEFTPIEFQTLSREVERLNKLVQISQDRVFKITEEFSSINTELQQKNEEYAKQINLLENDFQKYVENVNDYKQRAISCGQDKELEEKLKELGESLNFSPPMSDETINITIKNGTFEPVNIFRSILDVLEPTDKLGARSIKKMTILIMAMFQNYEGDVLRGTYNSLDEYLDDENSGKLPAIFPRTYAIPIDLADIQDSMLNSVYVPDSDASLFLSSRIYNNRFLADYAPALRGNFKYGKAVKNSIYIYSDDTIRKLSDARQNGRIAA